LSIEENGELGKAEAKLIQIYNRKRKMNRQIMERRMGT
jgi:hypothetical protein